VLGHRIKAARDDIQSRSALPDSLVEDMAQANLFQLYVPRSIGGPETDPVTAFRAVEELSEVDGSVGWCSFVATAISMYAAWMPPEVARELFGQPLDISTDRTLGLLAGTTGDRDAAVGHFEDALAFCRKASYHPELAWTDFDYSEVLLKRNGQGDRAKATSRLVEAMDISTELGTRPLLERIAALQEKADEQPVRASVYPDGLTQREIEVIRLVAAGKMDREIGEELSISVNTVGNHVRNILSKTDSANRTEAAAYAVRHGLTPVEESDES